MTLKSRKPDVGAPGFQVFPQTKQIDPMKLSKPVTARKARRKILSLPIFTKGGVA